MMENELKQNNLIPFTLLGALIIGIYFWVLEPVFIEWSGLSRQENEILSKLVELRKTFNEESGSQVKNPGNKNTIFLLNYLDALVSKSGINKLKNFQPVGVQASKGAPSYQLRFAANANALLKFMYLAEETKPRLAISNCRASSVAGGSYSGMRQLECQVTVSLVSKGNETKINIADVLKFKNLSRDPFSNIVYEEPKQVKVKEPEDAPEVPKWTLTAVMSEGDLDTLLFKKENNGEKYAVTLKKTGDITLAWVKEQIEITAGGTKVLWPMGETKTEDTLPKELVESIKSGETGKITVEKAPEGPSDDELKASDKLDEIRNQMTPDQMRNRRMPRRR
ncbi:MAG: hypothetical protein A2231_04160 [Candidatus Firestonebacteria bacterium RIFOXYA2_FULL_40_8]|nr:MAG: hypothetical protein A2231_04160 [Candidatus Firestonebacteria bacterium RIFOXYA2_FULL_40_8]